MSVGMSVGTSAIQMVFEPASVFELWVVLFQQKERVKACENRRNEQLLLLELKLPLSLILFFPPTLRSGL